MTNIMIMMMKKIRYLFFMKNYIPNKETDDCTKYLIGNVNIDHL